MAFSDQFAMSVTGAFQHRDGLGRFTQLENPRKEVAEMEDISARVAMKWSPNDKLSFLLTAGRRQRRRRPPALRHADQPARGRLPREPGGLPDGPGLRRPTTALCSTPGTATPTPLRTRTTTTPGRSRRPR
jgi:hypothetical protein